MTVLLRKIMTDLSRLSEEEQDSFAALIREEMLWKKTLTKPNSALTKLAREARTEFLDKKNQGKN